MSNAAAGVFISYRRQEADWLAAWLHDRLVAHFGEARVFLDIDWIKPGVDFMQVITEAIVRSRVLLVIIGPQWLAAEGDGWRRLDRPDDPVRVELETAFRSGLRVIPLLLDGASMPPAGDLPDTLAGLARLNALRVGYPSARSDLTHLVETLAEELGIAPTPGLQTADSAVGRDPGPRQTRSAYRVAPVDVGRDEEQRARLLARLSRTYTEFLDQSVEHDAILKFQLGLDWLPGRTFRPQDRLLPVPHRQAERLPVGTSLLQAFDQTGGLDGDGLLVLGEPGAGKTTLLFELAHRLTERPLTDPGHPLPVYLPLSSWATRRSRLDQWLVEQLNELYEIPHPLARRWTTGAQLLFVLDGLDEIPDRSDRIACVKAINQFNRFGRSSRLPVVVASRPVEYDTLPVKLQLERAVGVRPLDPTVVLDGLQHAPDMQAVVTTVRRDPELLELLRSPLLVSMLTLTYAGIPEAQIHTTHGTPAERRQQLVTDYVDRRFELDRLANGSSGRTAGRSLSPQHSRAWLSALALYLTHRQQTVFLLGRLQPDWLPARWARAVVVAAPGLIAALIGGLILAPFNRDYGWTFGLFGGLGAVLGTGLVGQPQAAKRLSWSWARARARLPNALIVGLIFGLSFGLIERLLEGLIGGLIFGLSAGLAAGLSVGICGGLSGQSAGLHVGLTAGLIGGLIVGVTFWLGYYGYEEPVSLDGLLLDFSFLEAGLNCGLGAGLSIGMCAAMVGYPEAAERLSWSWARARARLPKALILGLTTGLIVGLIEGLPHPGMLDMLGFGLTLGLILGLGVGLSGGVSKNQIPTYVTPNEGIRKSIHNGLFMLIFGLSFGLIYGLIYGLIEGGRYWVSSVLILGMIVGVPAGLLGGLRFGLAAAVQQGVLRLLLWTYRIAPLRYARWLNYSVHLRLLYRSASGGYTFIHRVVQDHFCNTLVDRYSQDSGQAQS